MKNIYALFQQQGGMLCLLMAIFLLPLQQLRAQDYWEEIAQLPLATNLASVEALGNSIYVMGGGFSASQATSEVYAFNPATKDLQLRSPLPKALLATATTVLNGKIYLFGGVQYNLGSASKSSYVYDPVTNAWTSLPDIPIAVGYAVAEAINGKIYLIGGFGSGGAPVYNLTQEYDPQTNLWQTKAPMLTARGYMCAAVFDNRIYVLGGGIPSTNTSLDAVEIYDPTSNSWATGSSLLSPRLGAAAGVLGNTIFVAGGANSYLPSPDLNVTDGYSPELGWQSFATLPFAVHGHAITAFEDNLYAFGGSSNGVGVKAILKYHPESVGTYNPLINNGLTVSPNPANERVIFLFENAVSGQMTLFGPDGAIVNTANLYDQIQHEFSVAALPTGGYFWKWMGEKDGKIRSGRILVLR